VTAETPLRSPAVQSVALTFASFALPISMLGVMWGDVRVRFDQSVGTLGFAALFYAAGRLSTATTGRHLVRTIGTRWAFTAVLMALAGSTIVLATAPTWFVFLAGLAMIGMASGMLDSLGAGVIATIEDIRSAGLIHGSYGVGSTVGPLAVALTGNWRLSVGLVAVVALVAAIRASKVSEGWPTDADGPPPRDDVALPQDPSASLPVLATTLSLLLFATFVALEVTSGQWIHTYLTEHRSVDTNAARIAVALFWGGLTVGRLSMGTSTLSGVIDRIGLTNLSGFATAIYLLFAVVPDVIAIVLPAIAALALAPVIPTLFARTTRRIGTGHTAKIAGWQLIATNLGAICVPLLVGILVDRFNPNLIAWTLVVVSAVGTLLLAFMAWHLPVEDAERFQSS